MESSQYFFYIDIRSLGNRGLALDANYKGEYHFTQQGMCDPREEKNVQDLSNMMSFSSGSPKKRYKCGSYLDLSLPLHHLDP
jgi:hypothetical protein